MRFFQLQPIWHLFGICLSNNVAYLRNLSYIYCLKFVTSIHIFQRSRQRFKTGDVDSISLFWTCLSGMEMERETTNKEWVFWNNCVPSLKTCWVPLRMDIPRRQICLKAGNTASLGIPPWTEPLQARSETCCTWGPSSGTTASLHAHRETRRSGWDPPGMPHIYPLVCHLRRVSTTPAVSRIPWDPCSGWGLNS